MADSGVGSQHSSTFPSPYHSVGKHREDYFSLPPSTNIHMLNTSSSFMNGRPNSEEKYKQQFTSKGFSHEDFYSDEKGNFPSYSYKQDKHDFGIPSSVSSYRSAEPSSGDVGFQHDVLLIYDPDTDYYQAEELRKAIEPQQLRIFDFAKDCPSGGAQSTFLESAFKTCKYTCIVVTRSFISNFWLKFKTDMAIQDMLQNQHKRYSVVVVVMDLMLKSHDLPLDLQTLTPIFQSSRFFQNKISKAFQGMPFPVPNSGNFSNSFKSVSMQDPTVHAVVETHKPQNFDSLTSWGTLNPQRKERLKSYSPIRNTSSDPEMKRYLSHNDPRVNLCRPQLSDNPEHYLSTIILPSNPPPYSPSFTMDYNHPRRTPSPQREANHQATEPSGGYIQQVLNKQPQSSEQPISAFSSQLRGSRTPREHCDTPPSSVDNGASSPTEYHRMVSITRNSNGARQPTEVDDAVCCDRATYLDAAQHASLPNASCSSFTSNAMNTIQISQTSEERFSPIVIPPAENSPLRVSHFEFSERQVTSNTPPTCNNITPSIGEVEISERELSNFNIPPVHATQTPFVKYSNETTSLSIKNNPPTGPFSVPNSSITRHASLNAKATSKSKRNGCLTPPISTQSAEIQSNSDSDNSTHGSNSSPSGSFRISLSRLTRKFRKH
uniref:Uncharacterized LOC100182356 n=1 Tax=Ciona intestinalis TaxID=7719 RepID=F6T9Y4_CIOIN|nr:uncharacterized protein LOC100182356 [Ciona intestinalis]|eukprot:XP_002128758.1 uncharacterized protein LOC100182356 [Ciona intestinalis]